MIQISCTINHKPVQVEVEEGETLMAMLRDRLGLTAVSYTHLPRLEKYPRSGRDSL